MKRYLRSEDASMDQALTRTYVWIPISRTVLLDDDQSSTGEEWTQC